MPLYEVPVRELRAYNQTYVVEADDATHALDKALIGDTVSESKDSLSEISDRETTGLPRLLEEPKTP